MEKSQSAATAWQEKFISSSDKKKVQRNKDMAQIYIAFVDTPGFFAGMIRQVIKQKLPANWASRGLSRRYFRDAGEGAADTPYTSEGGD